MLEPALKAHLQFLVDFCTAFLNKHFKFLQKYDPVAKDFGYLSRHMALRSHIMMTELSSLSFWETHSAFENTRVATRDAEQAYNAVAVEQNNANVVDNNQAESSNVNEEPTLLVKKPSTETMKKAINTFFKTATCALKKHFTPLLSENLAFALVGERQSAQAIAQWLISLNELVLS